MSDNKMMDKRHLNILRLFIFDAQAILTRTIEDDVDIHGLSMLSHAGRERPEYRLERVKKKIEGALKIIKVENKRAEEYMEKVWAEREKWEAEIENGQS